MPIQSSNQPDDPGSVSSNGEAATCSGSSRTSRRALLQTGLATAGLLLGVKDCFGLEQAATVPGQGKMESPDLRQNTINQNSHSRAHYFSWINNAWEGSNDAQTRTNLHFFKWLHDEYGMQLDFYALDAGNIDTLGGYGSMDSNEFKARFPNGFRPLVDLAGSFGCRLGMWLGPDGFGETPEQERSRYEMVLSLCRDYGFALLKFDSACSGLRPDKQEVLARLLQECRRYVPDLIVLNHRVDFGKAASQATTFLWEGVETYIDVHIANDRTATHHREGALNRGLPPDLVRLTEDHGVCLSSCLDYWEDDLVLQAFNRCLILAPEIYGNPWLLRDEELPKLARFYNLHRRYRDILTNGMRLPEEMAGPNAVSRGDNEIRFITLRNLSWTPVTYHLTVDDSIGLQSAGPVEVRQFHPSEQVLGHFQHGAQIDVQVEPFRSCLLMVSAKPITEIGVTGCAYEVVRDTPGKSVIIDLLGHPGTEAFVALAPGSRQFSRGTVGGAHATNLTAGKTVQVRFPGAALTRPWHRKLGELTPCETPPDAEALYEATCFAADNNALEIRSLLRSGPTTIPQIQASRDALLHDPKFVGFGMWDRQAFDGDLQTQFRMERGHPVNGGAFRVDFGQAITLRELIFRRAGRDLPTSADVSADLKVWTKVGMRTDGEDVHIQLPQEHSVRYVRINAPVRQVAEIEGISMDGAAVDRARWRASNLFGPYATAPAVKAWSLSFHLDEAAKGSYFVVAVNGRHGKEGAYAAARVDGLPRGATDRAVSFPSNVWEVGPTESDSNYSYYIPVTPDLVGKRIDLVLLGFNHEIEAIQPEAWITAYRAPLEAIRVALERR